MTCIVGVQTKDGVWIGGDSAGVSGWTLEIRADPKVFRVGEFLIGIAGCFRMGNLLRYAFEPPPLGEGVEGNDLVRYMVAEFVPALRAVLEAGGQRKKESEVETMDDGSFLVGVRGRLFEVCSDFQVGQNRTGYYALGSGCAVALGALHATTDVIWLSPPPTLRPADRVVLAALEAAQAHNIGVRAPFVVEKL